MLQDFIDKKTANVYGIFGNLGGGKSMTAVELAVYFLSIGWCVTSNIRLFNIPPSSDYTFIEDITQIDFWKLKQGAPRGSSSPFRSVIIIDEVAEFFDQWSSASPQLRAFMSWLRHSSKRGQFVFLVVQKPEFIAKSLRLLIHKWIVCTDMGQAFIPGLKIKFPFLSSFICRRVFDCYGNCISRGFNLRSKKSLGYYYSTAQNIARPEDFPPPPVPFIFTPFEKLLFIFLFLRFVSLFFYL